MSAAMQTGTVRNLMAASAIREVEHQASLRDRIGKSLSAAIMSGELAPGSLVTVPTLAQQFAVSATPVREALGNEVPRFEKIAFSSWQDEAIRGRIESLRADGRGQVVVAGMEAHVCVVQTSLDLLAAGLEVFLVADAVGSRGMEVRDIAIRRLERAGAHIVAHEMVAFEWLGRGDTKEFKDLIEVIK